MDYRVTINNQTFDLPKKTIAITQKVEEIDAVSENLSIEPTIRFEMMYSFIASVIGITNTRKILGSSVAKCDTNEILIITKSIIDVYNSPIKRYNDTKKLDDLSKSPLGRLMANKNA